MENIIHQIVEILCSEVPDWIKKARLRDMLPEAPQGVVDCFHGFWNPQTKRLIQGLDREIVLQRLMLLPSAGDLTSTQTRSLQCPKGCKKRRIDDVMHSWHPCGATLQEIQHGEAYLDLGSQQGNVIDIKEWCRELLSLFRCPSDGYASIFCRTCGQIVRTFQNASAVNSEFQSHCKISHPQLLPAPAPAASQHPEEDDYCRAVAPALAARVIAARSPELTSTTTQPEPLTLTHLRPAGLVLVHTLLRYHAVTRTERMQRYLDAPLFGSLSEHALAEILQVRIEEAGGTSALCSAIGVGAEAVATRSTGVAVVDVVWAVVRDGLRDACDRQIWDLWFEEQVQLEAPPLEPEQGPGTQAAPDTAQEQLPALRMLDKASRRIPALALTGVSESLASLPGSVPA